MASDAIVIAVGGPPWAVFEAEAQLHALERRWSRFLTNSDISRLNRDASATVDPETLVLIDIMQQAAVLTEGAFDPTLLRALVRAGYASSIDQPDRTTILPELDAPAVACSIAEVSVDPGTARVTLPPDLVLDAGGIGKGLAADLVVERLLDTGAVGALAGVTVALMLFSVASSPAIAWLAICVFGFANGLFLPAISSLMSFEAEDDERGAVMGVFNASSSAGRILGPALSGPIYFKFGPAAPFVLSAMLTVLGALLMARRARR